MSPAEASIYALISPVRNEAGTLACTVASVLAQTVPPVRWVFIDDGSSDETPGILDEAAEKHDFIRGDNGGDNGDVVALIALMFEVSWDSLHPCHAGPDSTRLELFITFVLVE